MEDEVEDDEVKDDEVEKEEDDDVDVIISKRRMDRIGGR